MEESAPLLFRFLECRVNVYSLEDRYDSILDRKYNMCQRKRNSHLFLAVSFYGNSNGSRRHVKEMILTDRALLLDAINYQ